MKTYILKIDGKIVYLKNKTIVKMLSNTYKQPVLIRTIKYL